MKELLFYIPLYFNLMLIYSIFDILVLKKRGLLFIHDQYQGVFQTYNERYAYSENKINEYYVYLIDKLMFHPFFIFIFEKYYYIKYNELAIKINYNHDDRIVSIIMIIIGEILVSTICYWNYFYT